MAGGKTGNADDYKAISAVALSSTINNTHLVHSTTLRPRQMRSTTVLISIAKIPSRYTRYSSEELWAFRALGNAIDIDQGLWEPRVHDIDKWWINQLNISPLRVLDEESADIIFVPATLRYESKAAISLVYPVGLVLATILGMVQRIY